MTAGFNLSNATGMWFQGEKNSSNSHLSVPHFEKKKNNQKESLQIRNTIREIKSYLDGLKNR